MNRAAIVCGLLLVVGSAHASDRMEVCAKMREGYGRTSPGYQVNAIVTTGQELAAKTNDYTDYRIYATYVVIFWASGQATVIEMQFPYITAIPSQGMDQEGRTWEVGQFTGICI